MIPLPAAWVARLESGAGRIALATAARGTIVVGTTLILPPAIGLGGYEGVAALGALGASMSDLGGLYPVRLAGMIATALIGGLLLFLGAACAPLLLVATVAMFGVAMAAGMARALGPVGTPVGLNLATAFLIGIQTGGADPGAGGAAYARFGLAYAIGGLWAVVAILAVWQARPYKRVELDLAGTWEALAELATTALEATGSGESAVANRRHERELALRHRAVTDAIERAQSGLGEMRLERRGGTSQVAQLYVLQRAAIRVAGAALALAEAEDGGAEIRALRRQAAAGLAEACRAVGRALARGAPELPLADLQARAAALSRRLAESGGEATAGLAVAQALRHLDSAAEALRLIYGHRGPSLAVLRAILAAPVHPRLLVGRVRANLTTQSVILRHALRVAAVAAAGLGVELQFALPHGIWLPMTAQVVLQPEYGNTIQRALQRSAGTLAGAVVAALLLEFLRGTDTFLAAICVLLFAMFFLLRSSYGWAVTFLTPLVILLLKLTGPDPWSDLVDRIAYSVAGAVLALAAIRLMWPQWERERLPGRLARAVTAERRYLAAVLAGLGPAAAAPDLPYLRREAEMALANADTAFQTMLAEPAARRQRFGSPFQALVNAQRLCRHTIALAALGLDVALPAELVAGYAGLIDAALADAATAIGSSRPTAARPDFDPALARLTEALAGVEGGGGAAAMLLGRITSDTTGLIASVKPREGGSAAPARESSPAPAR